MEACGIFFKKGTIEGCTMNGGESAGTFRLYRVDRLATANDPVECLREYIKNKYGSKNDLLNIIDGRYETQDISELIVGTGGDDELTDEQIQNYYKNDFHINQFDTQNTSKYVPKEYARCP